MSTGDDILRSVGPAPGYANASMPASLADGGGTMEGSNDMHPSVETQTRENLSTTSAPLNPPSNNDGTTVATALGSAGISDQLMNPGGDDASNSIPEAPRGQVQQEKEKDEPIDAQTKGKSKKNPKGEGKDKQSPQQQEAKAWLSVRNILKEYDGKTLEDWQNELGNLLTFAGLLSAVITGFIAYSLPKLEGNFEKTSVRLLTAIASGNTLGSDDLPEFRPELSAVQINTLWIISLTLSLMAAFFTLSVQQWLRHIPLPAEMPDREAIRLRQFRYDGMVEWGVPIIIALLPVLVQTSVVLFLAGLLILLQSLDATVSTSFIGVAGSLFSLYIITFILPWISSKCPYKSPLPVLAWLACRYLASRPRAINRRFRNLFKGHVQKGGGQSLPWSVELRNTPDWDRFWTEKERRVIDSSNTALETAAITLVANALAPRGRWEIRQCLNSLDRTGHCKILLKWITEDVTDFYPSFSQSLSISLTLRAGLLELPTLLQLPRLLKLLRLPQLPKLPLLPPLYQAGLAEIKKKTSTSELLLVLRSHLPHIKWQDVNWRKLAPGHVVRLTSIFSILCHIALPDDNQKDASTEDEALIRLLMNVRTGQKRSLMVSDSDDSDGEGKADMAGAGEGAGTEPKRQGGASVEKTGDESIAEFGLWMWLPTTLLLKACHRTSYRFTASTADPGTKPESEIMPVIGWARDVAQYANRYYSRHSRIPASVFEGVVAAAALAFLAVKQERIEAGTKRHKEFSFFIGDFYNFLDGCAENIVSHATNIAESNDPSGMIFNERTALFSISESLCALLPPPQVPSITPTAPVPASAEHTHTDPVPQTAAAQPSPTNTPAVPAASSLDSPPVLATHPPPDSGPQIIPAEPPSQDQPDGHLAATYSAPQDCHHRLFRISRRLKELCESSRGEGLLGKAYNNFSSLTYTEDGDSGSTTSETDGFRGFFRWILRGMDGMADPEAQPVGQSASVSKSIPAPRSSQVIGT